MKNVKTIPANLLECLKGHNVHPTDLVMYICSACNLRCLHCYVGDDLLNLEMYYSGESVIRFIRSFELLERVTILGGEPLLHPEFNHIVLALKHFPEAEKRLDTNLLKTKGVDWDALKKIGVRICVSLDGHNAQLHELMRGKNTFKRTLKNLQELIDAGHDIEVTHTLNSRNVHYFPEFLELCKSIKLKRLNLHRNTPRGNALKNLDLVLGATGWRGIVNYIREQASSSKTENLQVRYEIGFATEEEFQRLISNKSYENLAQSSYYSKAGGQRIVVYPDQKLYISSESFATDTYIGEIDDQTFYYNEAKRNELTLSQRVDFSIEDLNENMVGDHNYPRVLSVSYRESSWLPS